MNSVDSTNSWSIIQRAAFRFFFLYFLFYCFPFPFDSIILLKPIVQSYFNLLDFIVTSTGTHLLHVPVQVAFPGFDKVDDSYYGVTFLFIALSIALFGALIWSLLERRQTNYIHLKSWLQLYLRYFLAATLLGYGFAKFFPSQFQEVTASRLIMEVGEQTPMLLAWNFMGYSIAFTRITGVIEILAGLLLFFRRTTTMGALVATISFGFVALLDYCFNVPVKLFVSHLLLISLFLLLNDAKRLAAVLFLNNPVEAIAYPRLFKKERWRKGFVVFQAICIAGILYNSIVGSLHDARKWGRYAPRLPLYGIYQTNWFIRNQDTIPPLETDSLRWSQLVIDGGSWKQSGVIRFSNGRKTFYNISADTLKHTLQIQSLSDTRLTDTLRFATTSPGQLLVEGKWRSDSIKVYLSKRNLDNLPLLSDRFYIVND
jgi:uncharacterized membrane protein YphA (DoxX/SURF4 family)